jgi:DNA-binding protein YbaB
LTDPSQGPIGGFGDLFAHLEAARAELEAQQEAVESTVVEGHAASGAVVIKMTVGLDATEVHIDPAVIDPADPSLLEDTVLAALRDALGEVGRLRAEALAEVNPLAGGIDLNSIGGLMGNLDLEGLLGGIDLNTMLSGLSPDDDDEDDEDPPALPAASDEPEA